MNKTKTCNECNLTKNNSEFSFRRIKGRTPYLSSKCKNCVNVLSRNSYDEKRREYMRRWQKENKEKMKKEEVTCVLDGCEKIALSKNNLCRMHYIRKLKYGDPGDHRELNDIERKCDVDGCDNKHLAKGFCRKHYQRLKINGNLDNIKFCNYKKCRLAATSYGFCDDHYIQHYIYDNGHNDVAIGHINKHGYRVLRKTIFEHRFVMENTIGRKLFTTEFVHHIDGDKLNNKIENLELWERSHPSGQRLEDKIDFYISFLEKYGYKIVSLNKNSRLSGLT